MGPLLCLALYPTQKFHSVISESIKVSFFQVLRLCGQVITECCSGSLLSWPPKKKLTLSSFVKTDLGHAGLMIMAGTLHWY